VFSFSWNSKHQNSITSTGRHNRHWNEHLISALYNPFVCIYHEGIGPLDVNDCNALRFIVLSMPEVHFMVLSYRARTVLCWVITQPVVLISYRRMGRTYWSHQKGSKPTRAQFSSTSQREPEITQVTERWIWRSKRMSRNGNRIFSPWRNSPY
jgi:hypothetical protein